MKNEIMKKINSFLQEERASEADNVFNIFEISGIATSETHICSVLAELLDPGDTHRQEEPCYLDLFYDIVLEIDKPSDNSAVIVQKEFSIEYERRIDIVIQDGIRFIPIEVKIFAGEQLNQCADYVQYARDVSDGEAFLYYLTPDGRRPSDYSANDNGIKTISWDKIVQWLDTCEKSTKGEAHAPVRVILRQFIYAIKKFIMRYEIHKHRELIENRLCEIDKLLQEYNWERPKTVAADQSITYIVNESEALFFRVQSDSYSIVAGLITGVKNTDGTWHFGGGQEEIRKKNYSRLASKYGDGAKGWWLRKKVIVPYDKFYKLFDHCYLVSDCVSSIVDFYNDAVLP